MERGDGEDRIDVDQDVDDPRPALQPVGEPTRLRAWRGRIPTAESEAATLFTGVRSATPQASRLVRRSARTTPIPAQIRRTMPRTAR